MVPLGTAAFLPEALVDELREKNKHAKGIVEVLRSPDHVEEGAESKKASCSDSHSYRMEMIQGLDSLRWEKLIVGFDMSYGLIPLAHKKICSLAPGPRHPSFVTDYLFRF